MTKDCVACYTRNCASCERRDSTCQTNTHDNQWNVMSPSEPQLVEWPRSGQEWLKWRPNKRSLTTTLFSPMQTITSPTLAVFKNMQRCLLPYTTALNYYFNTYFNHHLTIFDCAVLSFEEYSHKGIETCYLNGKLLGTIKIMHSLRIKLLSNSRYRNGYHLSGTKHLYKQFHHLLEDCHLLIEIYFEVHSMCLSTH